MSKDRSGYVFQDKSGSWYARTTVTDMTGKRRNIKRRAKDKREAIALEDLCEACGLGAADLFGAVAAACYERGLDFSPLLRACYSYLEAIEATVRGALREGGSREREKIMKRVGFC